MEWPSYGVWVNLCSARKECDGTTVVLPTSLGICCVHGSHPKSSSYRIYDYECWLVIRSFSVCSEGRLELTPPPPTKTALQEELLFKCPVSLILEWEDSEGSVLYALPGVPAGLSSSCLQWTLDSYHICYGHLSPFPFLSHFPTQLLLYPRGIFKWTTCTCLP